MYMDSSALLDCRTHARKSNRFTRVSTHDLQAAETAGAPLQGGLSLLQYCSPAEESRHSSLTQQVQSLIPHSSSSATACLLHREHRENIKQWSALPDESPSPFCVHVRGRESSK